MSEQIRTSLLVEPQARIDGALFDGLTAADHGASEGYRMLTIQDEEIEQQVANFKPGDPNPDLRARHLDMGDLNMQHRSLGEFKQAVLSGELDAPNDIKQAYIWRVNELLGTIRMAQASQSGDMRRFAAYNTFIYGAPNPQIFAATADWFRHDAFGHLNSECAGVREAADAVLALVPDQGGSRQLLVPDPETFQRVRNDHYGAGGHYALLLAGAELPEKGPITRETGDPILEKVRTNIGADGYTIVDAPGSSWSVSNRQQQLQRPAAYRMPLQRFVGLGLGHEWTHALEWINGLRGPLGLAAFGLDRYENGNESRSLVREMVRYESFQEFAKLLRWQDIMRRHYSIALGYGTGSSPRTFGEVYKVVNAVDRLWERSKAPDSLAAADDRADKRTRALLGSRTLKGTDGKGGAYLKDKVYLEGHVAVWEIARDNPKAIQHGDSAKYDISNLRHIALLQRRGVIPYDDTEHVS